MASDFTILPYSRGIDNDAREIIGTENAFILVRD